MKKKKKKKEKSLKQIAIEKYGKELYEKLLKISAESSCKIED